MNERKILVVASNYEITHQVKQALRNRGFSVHSAYSHRDALYAVRQGQHDAALVDVGMRDRHSGLQTLLALAEQSLHPPLIAVALNGVRIDGEDLLLDGVLSETDEASIQRVVMQALRIPMMPSTSQLATNELAGTRDEVQQRIEEIQTLFALGRSLTEVLNLSEVLNRVVEAARRLTNAEEGMILLPDGEAGQLWLRAKVGIDVEVARNFRIKTQDTLAGAVFRKGKPLLIAEQGPHKVKTEYFVNALLYVPILLKGTPIGVLGVNNKYKHDVFTERDQELLLNLASYAAIAIENARIHEESVKQTRELKAMVDASEVINSSIALEQTLPNICEQFVQVLNVNRAEILQWEREAGVLRVQARYYRNTWRTGNEPKIDFAQRPALAEALETNGIVFVQRGGQQIAGETEYMEVNGAAAMLVLPIFGGTQAIGVVQAFYTSARQQPAADVLKRAHQLAFSGVVNMSGNEPQRSAVRFVSEVNEVLGSDWCECALVAPGGRSLNIFAVFGRAVWLTTPSPVVDLTGFPDLREALETQTPFTYAADGATAPAGARELLTMTRSRAIVGLPLVNRGKTYGLVLLGDSEHNTAFNSREIDLARAIVSQGATALENAHLVHDLEASLRELKETQERLIQTARLSAMGELAAAVAHQINNPLTTIVLDTELILLAEPLDSPKRETLEAVVRAGKRAAGVVRRLLAAARSTSLDERVEPVNVVTTIEDTLTLVKSHLDRSRIRLVAKLPKERPPVVYAVPGQLDDVWLNLLLNAHDALQGCEQAVIGIELAYVPGADWIEVIVWDNGPGIPESVVSEVFKPFFTTKPVGEGTGLGLHICRQVVERAGGHISVTSSPEEGTRFLVQLPIKRGD